MPEKPEIVPFTADGTTGFLHVPAGPTNCGLVLTHGAGANCQAPLLVALADAFASRGVHVLRCDLAFRQRKRFGPPHPAHAAEDRNSLRTALAAMRGVMAGRIYLGGHSYGGRQASMLASEDEQIAEGLLLLSYPLHPPNKPEQLRTAHFGQLRVPALFVHGTNDPFGTVSEVQAALRTIPVAAELLTIEGAGHDLKRSKFDVPGSIVTRFTERFGGALP